MRSISVVLPAYNEEANLSRTVASALEAVAKVSNDYEVIIVDDGSKDRTSDVARDLASQHSCVRLIRHEVNRGYGSALHTGFYGATKDLVFMTDSDGQFDMREVSSFLPYIEEADLVIGYRAQRQDPLIRRLNAFGWGFLVNTLFGYTARDVDCAFKLFKRDILDHIVIESRGAAFSAEFLVRAKRRGYKIREIPVSHLPRTAGKQTGARMDVILRAFRELIRFQHRLSSER